MLKYVPYIVDFLLVVVIGVCVLSGGKRGFVRTLLSFIGIFVIFAAATYLSGRLAGFVYEQFIRQGLINSVQENISSHTDLSGLSDLMKSGLIAVLTALGLISQSTIDSIVSKIDYLADPVRQAETIVDGALAEPVTQLIRVLLFIIILILCIIIFKAILSLSASFNNIPILGGFNKFLGALLGLVEGLVIAFILVYVTKTALVTTPEGTAMLENLNLKTVVFSLLSAVKIL